MKNTFRLLLILLFTISVKAQNLEYTHYDWDQKIDISKYELSEDPIVCFKEYHQKEYFLDQKYFFQIDLFHQILWLNSDDAIENYNKVYLPFNNTSTLLLSKARVIKSDGTVLELSEDKILTAEDEETQRKYKYYAMEGVEKGCFIEYIYAIKSYAHYTGSTTVLQADIPKKEVSFELISPDNLVFEFLAEGLPEINKDDLLEDKTRWILPKVDIPALINETMSPYKALLKKVVYKLDKNLYNPGNGISSYDLFAQRVFERMYNNLSSQDSKVVKKLVKQLGLKKLDKETAIRTIENYLKKNIFILKSDGLRPFNEIVEKKNANESEINKLFIQLCEAVDIKTELVFTTNRYQSKFHKKFESYNFLDAVLLYFPEVKKYTSPVNPGDRLGYPLYSNMANYGLFVKKVSVGDFTSAVAKIKYIEPLKAKESIAKMELKVSFPDDFDTTNIHLTRNFSGYKASYFQPFIHLLPEEKRQNIVDVNLKMYGEDVNILDSEMLNTEAEMYGLKPLIISGNLTYDGLITKAGSKYIFSFGDLIGPQMELYQENQRTLPSEDYFNKWYDREIEISIPEGYEVKGLEKINMEVYFDPLQKDIDGFISTYEIKDNKIVVNIQEYYNQLRVEAKDYDNYIQVINAAADFNKIKLVFVKKG